MLPFWIFRIENIEIESNSNSVSGEEFTILIMEATHSSEMWVLIGIRRHVPEDSLLHRHGRESLRSYIYRSSCLLRFPWGITLAGKQSNHLNIFRNQNTSYIYI